MLTPINSYHDEYSEIYDAIWLRCSNTIVTYTEAAIFPASPGDLFWTDRMGNIIKQQLTKDTK